MSQYSGAAEVYEKMQDVKALVSLYVETQQWDMVSECVWKKIIVHNQLLFKHVSVILGIWISKEESRL